VNNPLDVKENDEDAFDFALHLSHFFLVCPEPSMALISSCTAHAFFPECLSDYCQGVCHIFSKMFTKFDACCSFVASIMKLHQVRYTTPNKKT
jgi:hypothetical protein